MADFDSPFEEQVAAAIRQLGFEIHAQVGVAGYRIDLGILDPSRPGRYLLGIECDGATYHSSKVARDRDRIRQAVLEGLGWTIHRIWSTDWWFARSRCVEELADAINAAAAEGPRSKDPEPDPPAEPSGGEDHIDEPPADTPEWPPDASPWRTPAVPGGGSKESFYEHSAGGRIASQIDALLVAAPLPVDAVCRMVARAWGMARTGRRIKDRIQAIIARRARVQHGVVWRRDQDPSIWSGFRYAQGEPRHIDLITAPEVANAAAWVVERAVSIDHEELVRATAEAFGFQSLGRKIRQAMTDGIKLLIERPGFGVTDGRVHVLD